MPKIRFAVINQNRSHVTVRVATCLAGDTFATNGQLTLTPEEWALGQRQLCPSAYSEHAAALEIITSDDECAL